MIKALIFDCFGVLYRDNISMIYDLMPREKHLEFHDIIHASDQGLISRQQYFEQTAELIGKTTDEVREIELKQFVRNEQLIEKLIDLKKDFKIGLLSNIGDETMDRLFPEPERSQLFDVFVLSSQVGLLKPAAGIFEAGAAMLELPTEECVMIDDIPSNVEGARAVGMSGILFTTNHQFEIDIKNLLEN